MPACPPSCDLRSVPPTRGSLPPCISALISMATSPLPRTGPLCSANEGPPLLSSGRPLGWGETDSHAPAQDETQRSPVCPPLPAQARATTSVGVCICPSGGERRGVCVCARRRRCQKHRPLAQVRGAWEPASGILLCVVCVLCVTSYLPPRLSLFRFACLSVCLRL